MKEKKENKEKDCDKSNNTDINEFENIDFESLVTIEKDDKDCCGA